MTTVSASRPMTMAGRPGTSQQAEETAPWDDPVAEQWEAPLAHPAEGGTTQSAGYDRPKTAGGSRSVYLYMYMYIPSCTIQTDHLATETGNIKIFREKKRDWEAEHHALLGDSQLFFFLSTPQHLGDKCSFLSSISNSLPTFMNMSDVF